MALYTGTHPIQSVSYDTNLFDDDQNIDAEIKGTIWDMTSTNILAFSFITNASQITHGNNGATFDSAFSATWQAQAILALGEFEKFLNITFEEQTSDPNDGVLRFANATGLNTAFGYYPNSGESGGDMMFNNSNYDADANVGTYTFHTMMHEIGHAMGLKHGHDTSGPGSLTADKDSMEYSVMTYSSHTGSPPPFYAVKDGHYAQTMMMYDIATLHRLYGADFTDQASDSEYTFNTTTGEMFINGVGQGAAMTNGNVNSNVTFRTVWDGNGVDHYNFSNFTTDMAIDLTPESYTDFDVNGNTLRSMLNQGWDGSGNWVGAAAEVWAVGHLFNALQSNGDARSLIEHATGGSGNDIMMGNTANNRLEGMDGDDTIMGGDGKDAVRGGNGDDDLLGGTGRDGLRGGQGNDFLDGEDGKDVLRGGKGKDRLEGGVGNDILKGEKGKDVLFGQEGNDTLFGGVGQSDRFLYTRGDGYDVIKDFEIGLDKIQIFANASWTGYSVNDNGSDLVVDYGYNRTVTLEGLTGQTLTASDFIIV